MDKIAGYGKLEGTLSSGNTQQSVTTDTAAETFVTEGLSKVIKMNNMCYSDNITDCNFPATFTSMGGNSIALSSILTLKDFNPLMMSASNDILGNYEQLNTKAAAYNKKLIDMATGVFWSGHVVTSGASGKAWYHSFNNGARRVDVKTSTVFVRCVKK